MGENEERRQEERTMLGSIPDDLKDVLIKYPGSRPFPATTVDVSSIGMAFISNDKIENNLEIGKQVTIRFNCINSDIKGSTVYCYPIPDSRKRIGVLFKNEKSIRRYYKMLKIAES